MKPFFDFFTVNTIPARGQDPLPEIPVPHHPPLEDPPLREPPPDPPFPENPPRKDPPPTMPPLKDPPNKKPPVKGGAQLWFMALMIILVYHSPGSLFAKPLISDTTIKNAVEDELLFDQAVNRIIQGFLK